MRTQVGIVCAGSAGLMLSHLLQLGGIDSVVIENRSRRYVEERVRAGVLEQGTVDLLIETGLGERLQRQGLVHHRIEIRFNRRGHRIDFADLTGGKAITILCATRNRQRSDRRAPRRRRPGSLRGRRCQRSRLRGGRPTSRFRERGEPIEVTCDFIAGCDGFHGVCRPTIPDGALTMFERVYRFAWLGILAEVAPSSEELIYANHERGFALHSMRSPEITRLYLQCAPDEALANWPDDRIWEEFHRRFASDDGWTLHKGPIVQKGVTGMRSFVVEPMQYGKLFLAGDAAHIVPPTGAKGLNLAVADVRVLARGTRGILRVGFARATRQVLGDLPATGVAGAALFIVDDFDAASLRRRQRVRSAPPNRGTRLCFKLARRGTESRGKLRRPFRWIEFASRARIENLFVGEGQRD